MWIRTWVSKNEINGTEKKEGKGIVEKKKEKGIGEKDGNRGIGEKDGKSKREGREKDWRELPEKVIREKEKKKV
jgi:hypothetical protein